MQIVYLLITLCSSTIAVRAAYFATCNSLNFQWNPIATNYTGGNRLEGVLSVARKTLGKTITTTETKYGKFYLQCNDNSRIVNPGTTDTLIAPGVEVLVNFSLQQLSITQPNKCSLQYCFTESFGDDCTMILCNITLPQLNPSSIKVKKAVVPRSITLRNSYTEPVYFQWIPISSTTANLIITYYKIKNNRNYQYGVTCVGLVVGQYRVLSSNTSSGGGNYKIVNASLTISTTEFPSQYSCQLTVCIDRQLSENCQENYNIIIPDVNVVDRSLLLRSNLLYRHWDKPNFGVEELSDNCNNVKFYWKMDSVHRGELIVQYSIPSAMESSQGQFSVSCGAQVRQAKIPNVSLQRYLGTITTIFTLEYFNQNTFCSLDLCLYEGSGLGMKCIWQEDAYCSPVFLFKANVQEKTLAENNVALKEAKCHVNTWSWVIYNSKEAEVHFLLADDIIAAARYSREVSFSCANLTVVGFNPQSMQYILENGDVASFVITAQGVEFSNGFQECVLRVCIPGHGGGCILIYKCYVTFSLYLGAFQLTNQSNKLEACPESLWQWDRGADGGTLSITFSEEDKGEVSIDCSGVTTYGQNVMNNTNSATFQLFTSHENIESSPYCNVHICVRQDQLIGCTKSLDCVITIPSNKTSRSLRSYEEPSEELFQDCEQENLDSNSTISLCSNEMWNIINANRYAIGEAHLQINLQGNDKTDEFLKVALHCYGLNLRGSTEYRLVLPKTQKEATVEFNVSLPQSINEETITYLCKVKTQRRSVSHTEQADNTMCPSTMSCSISVKTILGRIVPKCNATEGRRSIHQVDVVRNQAKVEITVSASPNTVYAVDPYCNENNPFGHNTTEELLANTFPSTTTGEGHVTIAVSFNPDCDNKTAASYFMNKRSEDCLIDIYWYCQGGEQLLKSIRNLQFADKPMYCEAQSIVKRLILSLEKSFGVYSQPIAILLAILIGVTGLYGLLIPISLIVACYHCGKKSSGKDYQECEVDEWSDDALHQKRNSTKPLISSY